MDNLNLQQIEELKIIRKFGMLVEKNGIGIRGLKNNQNEILQKFEEVIKVNYVRFNQLENGNKSPDVFLDQNENIGLEIFEISMYNRKQKNKVRNIAKDYKTIDAEMTTIHEKAQKNNGVYSYGDDEINDKIKQKNYNQDYCEMKNSVIHLIKKHMKTYPKTLEKRGLLIDLIEPFMCIHQEKNIPESQVYSIFREEEIIEVLKKTKVDFAFFINGETVYFWEKSIEYKKYNDTFQPFYINQRIGYIEYN